MAAHLSDHAALRRYARQGDPEALEVLIQRYHAMVLATCRRALGADGVVSPEDAAQEVFLKLARHAGRVKSSAAAWLHACALGTSVDLIRRADARRRAESRAATDPTTRIASRSEAAATDSAALWRDLEPVIDRALAQLDERDRALIVARFLAGRTQAELAREAGVSEGTLSRRLHKALANLRARLADAGLAVPSRDTLAVALASASAIAAAATFDTAASLGKIALAGIARPGTPGMPITAGALATKIAVAAAITIALAGAVITPALLRSNTTAAANSTTQPTALGPERPRAPIGPFQVVTASDRSFAERGLWITDDRIAIRHGFNPDGEPRRATLNITRTTPVKDDPETAGIEERATLDARVASITPIDDAYHRFRAGQRLTLTIGFDSFGRLVLIDTTDTVQLGKNEPRWSGVRPPPGWPEFGRIPEDAGPLGIRGPWTESERIPVTIDDREIYFGASNWVAARYRIIEWDRVQGHTRVLSINAGGRDPRLIGTRFPLLLREDDAGYTMAYFPEGSPRYGDFPSSFEFSPQNPVLVVSFAKDPG